MLRITAGACRGRRISAPREIRPTTERVREAVFSTLQQFISLEGRQVWDIFAGSGALGLEALSRGAEQGTFVDSGTTETIRNNLDLLELSSRARVYNTCALSWLGTASGKAEVVFLDPPYDLVVDAPVLKALSRNPSVEVSSIIVYETSTELRVQDYLRFFEVLKVKSYGSTKVSFLRKTHSIGYEDE